MNLKGNCLIKANDCVSLLHLLFSVDSETAFATQYLMCL